MSQKELKSTPLVVDSLYQLFMRGIIFFSAKDLFRNMLDELTRVVLFIYLFKF